MREQGGSKEGEEDARGSHPVTHPATGQEVKKDI